MVDLNSSQIPGKKKELHSPDAEDSMCMLKIWLNLMVLLVTSVCWGTQGIREYRSQSKEG